MMLAALQRLTQLNPVQSRRALCIVGCFLVAAALGLFLFAPRHRIDVEHSLLIRQGMTQAEVEALLGAPADSYDGYELSPMWEDLRAGVTLPVGNANPPDDDAAQVQVTWTSRRGAIEVFFWVAPDGYRVAWARWHRSYPHSWVAQVAERLFGSFNQFQP
jgi:hypothetical protein